MSKTQAMPDGTESKDKKPPVQADPQTAAEHSSARQVPLGIPLGRGRTLPMKRGLAAAVLLLALVFAGYEIYQRINYVYAYDSRIDGDLITVSSRVAGWVTSMDVTEGGRIEKGNVLATIDGRESELLVTEMQAQMSAMEAQRERLAAQRRLVDKQTASLYSSVKSQLAAAQVTVSSLAPQLKLAKREFQRAKELFERKVTSRRQLDQAENAEQRIEREHRIAVAALQAAKAKLGEAEAERAQLDVLDGDINILYHRKTEMQAKVEHQKLDLGDRTIRSPVNGVVDKTFVKAGEYVTPGQRLAIVHDPKNIWIEANVKETQISHLKIGQRVEISVDAYPDTAFEGRVLSIGNATTAEFALLPSPNPSGNFTKITQRVAVRIAIEQKDDLLRPGMMVEINIDLGNP